MSASSSTGCGMSTSTDAYRCWRPRLPGKAAAPPVRRSGGLRRRQPSLVAPQPVGVATQLPRHRRRRPPEDGRNGPDRVTAGPAERDLFPLRQRQTPTLQVPAPTRSDPTHRSQPTTALLAITARRDRGIVDELPSSHARPEHLIDLRNHPIREPHTTPPIRDVAITARTRGSANGTRGIGSRGGSGPGRARMWDDVVYTCRLHSLLRPRLRERLSR
jgi:hypothetical protein